MDENVEKSIFHGALPKVMRIHAAITGFTTFRATQNWQGVFQSCENMYIDLRAWAPKKKAKGYEDSWNKLVDVVNSYVKEPKKGAGTKVSEVSLNFFLESMDILKLSGLDTASKENEDPYKAMR